MQSLVMDQILETLGQAEVGAEVSQHSDVWSVKCNPRENDHLPCKCGIHEQSTRRLATGITGKVQFNRLGEPLPASRCPLAKSTANPAASGTSTLFQHSSPAKMR